MLYVGLPQQRLFLSYFFPMFPFDPPENISKSFGFLMFSGESKGDNASAKHWNKWFIDTKWVKTLRYYK